jgi:hypothetical protein
MHWTSWVACLQEHGFASLPWSSIPSASNGLRQCGQPPQLLVNVIIATIKTGIQPCKLLQIHQRHILDVLVGVEALSIAFFCLRWGQAGGRVGRRMYDEILSFGKQTNFVNMSKIMKMGEGGTKHVPLLTLIFHTHSPA